MPPTSSNAPLEVLVQIRDLLAEMLGQTHHEAAEEYRSEAERTLEKDREKSAELGEGTPVPDRPGHHQPDDGGRGRQERLAAEQDEARKKGDPKERKKAKGEEKDSFETTMGLLGSLGMGEVASILTRMRDAGSALQELLGFGNATSTLEQADPRRLIPEGDRPEPIPLVTPGIESVPHNLPTVEQAEPLPDLPAPLVPDGGHDPRKDTLPDLPAPLTPEATPPVLPEWLVDRDEPPAAPSLPDWMRDHDEPPTQPTQLHNVAEERQSQRRETMLADGSRPTMLAPQPGQGTTQLATQDEDEDEGDVIGQSVPNLAPGPTPATTPPDSQQQQDQQRLAIALEKLVALLQRESGGPTGDDDSDETEQSENFEPRGFWKPEQAAAAGMNAGQQAAEKEPPLHPSTQQQGDPLKPEKDNAFNLTDAIAGMARFLGS